MILSDKMQVADERAATSVQPLIDKQHGSRSAATHFEASVITVE
jgi:hypothetical protein